MHIRRLVLLLSALGLSLVIFAAPVSAAASPTSLSLTFRNQQGHVVSRLHPSAFHFLDESGHPLPEGQLAKRTTAGAVSFTMPGVVAVNGTSVRQHWASATLRISETRENSVKVKLTDPVVTALSFPSGKTSMTIEYASLTLEICGRLIAGDPVTCH